MVSELKRIFLGDTSGMLFAEIIFRTVVMYLYALLMIRLMGKRGMKQLSPFELTVVIALGSAVGEPMIYPEVPLLYGMIALTTMVTLERGLAVLITHSKRVETFVEGSAQRLVADGRLDRSGMEKETFSRDELFALLRQAGVEQLGQVKRAYLEESGNISTFFYEPWEIRPGLPLIPPWDVDRPDTFEAGTAVSEEGLYACTTCGDVHKLEDSAVFPACPRCEGSEWMPAAHRPDKELEKEEN